MNNTPEHDGTVSKFAQSRRRFITWAGEIVAGATLAGIGIGILTPKEALAEPECYTCQQCCTIVSCQGYGGCPPNMQDRVTYHAFYGCVPLGESCPYTVYVACQNGCGYVSSNCSNDPQCPA